MSLDRDHAPDARAEQIGAGTDDIRGLAEVLELLEDVVHRVDALDAADTGPAADEEIAVRLTRATLAAEDSRRVRTELGQARDRLREAVEQARRARTGSREERERRHLAADATGGGAPSDLTAVLDRAARGLLARGEESVEHTLRLVVAGAISALAPATRAGITVAERDGTLRSRAPSDDVVAELDALQHRLDEGPCRDVVVRRAPVMSHDVEADRSTWPRFAAAARRHGIAAIVSFQLFDRDGAAAAALNVYTDDPAGFDESDTEAGALFASHAALALHGARRTEQLNDALRSRDVIGQAKGILIERFGLSEDRAFALLVSSSQEANMKLRAVAEWVVNDTTAKNGSEGSEGSEGSRD